MPTLFDLDLLTVEPTRGSAKARTQAWALQDAERRTVGFVTERVGSAYALLRRHMSTTRYRYEAIFDVTDESGAVELVLTRRPATRWKTTVAVEAALADGTVVARATETARVPPRFDATDAHDVPIVTVARTQPTLYTVTEPDDRPLGEIRYAPITRSLIRPDGRDHETFEIEYRPEAAARDRIATLAIVIAHNSSRFG